MWRWATLLLAGGLLASLLSPSMHRAVASSSTFRETGDIRAPGKTHSSWGKRLNPAGLIPKSGFQAYYFSRSNPGLVVFQENVAAIAIKYAWANFHGLNSPQFAAYWVGKRKFSRPTVQQISVSQSWAKSHILIDGEVVFDESNASRTFRHEFSAGEHVIEVEFINNWHTVEYKVTIDEVVKTISEDQVSTYLGDDRAGRTRLYYVGLYESASKDTSVNVSLPSTGLPVVLWLSSYEAIDWNVISSDPIPRVFVNSYAPGSRVRGSRVRQVAHLDRSTVAHSESKRCSCVAGIFNCEDNQDLVDVASNLRVMTHMELSGYAVRYSAADVAVQPYTGDTARRILAQRRATESARKVCFATANPDFDNMMK
jgi:hypothetical protein